MKTKKQLTDELTKPFDMKELFPFVSKDLKKRTDALINNFSVGFMNDTYTDELLNLSDSDLEDLANVLFNLKTLCSLEQSQYDSFLNNISDAAQNHLTNEAVNFIRSSILNHNSKLLSTKDFNKLDLSDSAKYL